MGDEKHADARTNFLVVWTAQKERLHRLCLHWLGGDREASKDAVAQVALKAMEELASSHEPITNYPAWLTRLARNACIDMHRERMAKRRALDRLGSEVVHGATHTESPETEELRRELGQHIRDAIDRLPPRLLAAARLRFIENTSYDDMAEKLALSEDATRKRIQDARDILWHELSLYLHHHGAKAQSGAERHKRRVRERTTGKPLD